MGRTRVGLVVALLLPLIASALFMLYLHKQRPFDDDLTVKLQQPESPLSSSTTTMEIFGVKIERNPSQSKLADLGVTSWPKWGCPPSKFPWTFSATETMYLLEGKVKVFVEGYDGSFEIGGGDLVVFPKGMKITWDVLEAVNKHYHLDNEATAS